MGFAPCLVRSSGAAGSEQIHLGHPLLDSFLDLVADRAASASVEVPTGNMPLALLALHRWLELDSWAGIGAVERGMHRQGYDLSLTRYANEGWRATFYPSGKEHSPTSATGSAWEPVPWRAVQVAAWEALTKADVAAA